VRKFWLSPNVVGNGALWLIGGALEIGDWVSQPIAYALFGAAIVWTIFTVIYWRNRKKTKEQLVALAEGISPDLSEKLKATGRLEDISQGDALWIMAKSIEMQAKHGYNDLLELFADRASGIPLNELMTRPCSQCGIPRNQRGKHSE
jgi:hypothetical protein